MSNKHKHENPAATVSRFTKSILNFRECQEAAKVLKANVLLLGQFDPDTRPFEWAERKARRQQGHEPEQPALFEDMK